MLKFLRGYGTGAFLKKSLQNGVPAQWSGAESSSDLGVDINFEILNCSSIPESH